MYSPNFRWMAAVVAVATLSACSAKQPADGHAAANKSWKASIDSVVSTLGGALSGRAAADRGARASNGEGAGAHAGATTATYMDVQEIELREQLAGTGVSVTRSGDDIILNMPGNAAFGVNRAEINPAFHEVLNSMAQVVMEYDRTLIDIAGHTDDTGPMLLNMDLSLRRAEGVANYLETRGIARVRIDAKGYGPINPVADNTTAEGRQLNRRVEVALRPLT